MLAEKTEGDSPAAIPSHLRFVLFIFHNIGNLAAHVSVLHLLERERPFEVVKSVKLAKIDYENFITDTAVGRKFIEDHAALCEKGEAWRCLLVQQRGRTDGVLVMPEDGCFVGWATYYQE